MFSDSKYHIKTQRTRDIFNLWTESSSKNLYFFLISHSAGTWMTMTLMMRFPLVILNDSVIESIITGEKLEWAVNTFSPFKSSGLDSIFPAMLQNSSWMIIPRLVRHTIQPRRMSGLSANRLSV